MTTTLEQQTQEKGFAASSSVVAAIFLTALKLVVGIMTGSLGILAEAAHSALDLGAALITWFAVRVSDRPADEEHLYGHGKVENLSALAETILLLVTCVWIIYEAINRLFFEMVEVDPSIWAFLTMGISIVVDFSRSRVLYRAAKKYNSQALEADALHFSTDIWSSAVVIIGLALVWLGEQIGQKSVLMRADAIAALVVALIVIYVSIRLGKRTIDALLDTAPRGLAAQITATVARLDDVQQVMRTRVRGSGSQVFVELWVAVPRHLSFEESHAVTHQIRDAVHSVSPNADVVVTTVPSVENEGIFETIQSVAARSHLAVHNISTHLTKKGVWIDLDLEVAPGLSFDQAHALATDLETRLHAELGASKDVQRIADINVHIEPRAEELIKGQELTPQDAAKYIAQIHAFSQTIPHVRECQDIDVQRLDGQVYLAFHLRLDSDLSIADVHSATEEMENRLRREFPTLGRVVIHAEPAQVKSQK
ncbi:MAG: cation-efflux pump [Anaerolineales bacterium]|nr:cation-efflux pump [Anaerolineales bacterium]